MKIDKSIRHDKPRIINLPLKDHQNGLPMVLVRKEALYEMYNHAGSEMHHEIAGYLLGFPAKDAQTGERVTYIEKAIRAIYDSTPSHVVMHATSFNDVETIRKQDGTIVVGYYHSHPRLNIFLSSTDVKNFEDYHSEDYQIAVVVDPSQAPSRHIESSLEWIGFFGWGKNGNPVRLSTDNIAFVEKRPESVMHAEDRAPVDTRTSFEEGTPAPSSERSLDSENKENIIGLEVVEKIEQVSSLLRQGSHQFDSNFPIIIVSERIRALLSQNDRSVPSTGLLLGEINHVANYNLVSVIENHPFELEGEREEQGFLQNLLEKFLDVPAPSSSLPIAPYSRGLRCVGFYCPERKLTRSYATFARYCEGQCVITVTQIMTGNRTVALKFGLDQNKNPVEIPASHIFVTR